MRIDELLGLSIPKINSVMSFMIWLILGCAALIQIAPIQIYPLKVLEKLVKFLGKTMNNDVLEEVKGLKGEVQELRGELKDVKDSAEKEKAITARVRILTGGDELRRGVEHSEDWFKQMYDNISTYDAYCRAHMDFRNGITTSASQLIDEKYNKCLRENSFL